MIKKIFSTEIFKDSFNVFATNLLSKVLGFLIIFIIVKQLSVPDYGKLTVLLAIITTVSEMVAAGLNASILRYTAIYRENQEKLNKLLVTNLINIFFIGLGIIILVYFTSSSISLLILGNENFSKQIEIVSYGVLFTFLYGALLSFFLGLQNYKAYFIYSILFQLIRLIILLLIIDQSLISIDSFLVLFVITPVVTFLIGIFFIKNLKFKIKYYDKEIVKETYHFGKWMFLWAIVVVVQSKMDIFLLSSLTTPEDVSYYDIAQKFVLMSMIVFTSYGAVLKPRMSVLTSKESILSEVKGTYKVIFGFNLYIILLIFILPFIIKMLFGDDYINSIIPLQIMLASLILFVWTLPFNTSMYAFGKSNVFFFIAFINLIVNIISSLTFIPIFGAIGGSISFFIVNVSSLLFSYIFYKYHLEKQ